jgi:hypothetical protein
MEIDWPRTIGTTAITTVVFVAIYAADAREALQAGEDPGGCVVIVAILAGLLLGVAAANLLST